MDINTHILRSQNGEGYFTVIDDNTIINWVPLSIGDFYKYQDLFRLNNIALSVLEDEIFCKCVTDKNYINDINNLPAGLISLVVNNIISYSGPSSFDEFNIVLNNNRILANLPIHILATYIVRAFPSYKLEDVYNMNYELFMFRLAQAETLLLKLKIINEPIELIDEAKQPTKHKISEDDMKLVKERWEKQKKDLDKERVAAEAAMGSEEQNDLRASMVKESANIFKDKIKTLPYYKQKGG